MSIKHEFGAGDSLRTIMKFLHFNSPDSAENETMLLCTIETIWSTVCGNCKHENVFFEQEGLSQLLDLLEENSYAVRRHVLGCVLDLLENPKGIYMALQWRTKGDVNRGIAHLMIQLWTEDQARISKEHPRNQSSKMNEIYPYLESEKKLTSTQSGVAIPGLNANLFVYITHNSRRKSTPCSPGSDSKLALPHYQHQKS